MEQCKVIFQEPKSNKAGEFDKMLSDYNETIKSKVGGGAMMFCVYRGKVKLIVLLYIISIFSLSLLSLY